MRIDLALQRRKLRLPVVKLRLVQRGLRLQRRALALLQIVQHPVCAVRDDRDFVQLVYMNALFGMSRRDLRQKARNARHALRDLPADGNAGKQQQADGRDGKQMCIRDRIQVERQRVLAQLIRFRLNRVAQVKVCLLYTSRCV